MIRSGKRAVAALGLGVSLVAVGAGGAWAQDPPAATCSADDSKPSEVGIAYLRLSQVSSAPGKEQALKNLREAIIQAEKNIERGQNLPGRAYIMAKAYVLMLSDTLVPPVTTRGAVGLSTNPAGSLDLVVAVDSLLDILEAAHPDCVSETEQWRQNNVWLDILNKAIVALDAGLLDSAEYYAKRTQILHENNPYGYQVLATVANRRSQQDVERDMWLKTIEKAGTDTALADVKSQALFFLGNMYATQAEAATAPADKSRLAGEAVKVYQQYLTVVKPETDVSVIRTNLSLVMGMTGDSAAIIALYKPMLDDPAKFSTADLLGAGGMASRLNRAADAAKLYEAVLAKSPFNRDALFWATASYVVESQWEKALPLGHRLMAVDPGHPENLRFLAHAYSGIAQASTGAKKTAYTDSLVKASMRADSMPHTVSFNGWTTTASKATVDGMLQNMTKAPRSFVLSFSFLDAQGNSVASKDVTVGPVDPAGPKLFQVEVDTPGVIAFKYTIK
jgi:tetratricopeptide (TPR) repeat protein